MRASILPQGSRPGMTRSYLFRRHSGMRLRSAIADLRRQTRNLEIPGSLAQRKIDASINFAARLAPRNDAKLPVPPSFRDAPSVGNCRPEATDPESRDSGFARPAQN